MPPPKRLSPRNAERARCLILHPLKGSGKGRWSIWVNGNWRITFEFRDGDAFVLDYEDYH